MVMQAVAAGNKSGHTARSRGISRVGTVSAASLSHLKLHCDRVALYTGLSASLCESDLQASNWEVWYQHAHLVKKSTESVILFSWATGL